MLGAAAIKVLKTPTVWREWNPYLAIDVLCLDKTRTITSPTGCRWWSPPLGTRWKRRQRNIKSLSSRPVRIRMIPSAIQPVSSVKQVKFGPSKDRLPFSSKKKFRGTSSQQRDLPIRSTRCFAQRWSHDAYQEVWQREDRARVPYFWGITGEQLTEVLEAPVLPF